MKAVLLDEAGRTARSCYRFNRGLLMTLDEVIGEVVDGHCVSSVGVTGSGRGMASIIVGADVVETEVLAHAVAVLDRHPAARTVFDIGGEDGKIISLRSGTISDFRMNHVCGAGTGAVIDAIADRLGVSMEEVGSLALTSTKRLEFPGKCGVFCQSAVVSRLNSGVGKADILMGVLRALAGNFLLIARGIRLVGPYVFQGATAKNVALVKALEESLDDEVTVPEGSEFMGAVGAALLAGNPRQTKFRGVSSVGSTEGSVMIGTGCENRCEIVKIVRDGRVIGSHGNQCDKCMNVENS